MEATDITLQVDHIQSSLIRDPIYNNIFSYLSPAEAIRFGRTCRVAYDAFSDFSSRAFNINRHLLRFLSKPVDFRSLQARTGSLISGSNALQFFDRSFYPESDLDIFTHPGHSREVGQWLIGQEGYIFVPREDQKAKGTFESVVPELVHLPAVDEIDSDYADIGMSGVDDVYTFEKVTFPTGQPLGIKLKLQIISTTTCPLQCILNFHSTCVMNIIAFDAAYAFYPRATFEERRTLKMNVGTDGEAKALAKYAQRGWRSQHQVLRKEECNPNSSLHMNYARSVADKFSWVIPLDMTGVQMRPPPSQTSALFTWDPVVQNGWTFGRDKWGELYMIHYSVNSSNFRYNYIVAEKEYYQYMEDTIYSWSDSRPQRSIKHEKEIHLSDDEIKNSVTWRDSELPGLREKFLLQVSELPQLARGSCGLAGGWNLRADMVGCIGPSKHLLKNQRKKEKKKKLPQLEEDSWSWPITPEDW